MVESTQKSSEPSRRSAVSSSNRNREFLEECLVVSIRDESSQAKHTFRHILPSCDLLLYTLNKLKYRILNGHRPSVAPTIVSPRQQPRDNDIEAVLTELDWEELRKGATLCHYRKGDIIVQEGDEVRTLYNVARGQCRVMRLAQSENVIRYVNEGEMFGEIMFVEAGRANASVVASEDHVVVYAMNQKFVESLTIENPRLTARFYKFLAMMMAERLRAGKRITRATDLIRTKSSMENVDRLPDSLQDWLVCWRRGELQLEGTLMLTESALYFDSQLFAARIRHTIPLSVLTNAVVEHDTITITCHHTTAYTYECAQSAEIKQTIAQHLLQMGQIAELHFNPDVDWGPFLDGVVIRKYALDQVVIFQGDLSPHLYQIARGGVVLQEMSISGSVAMTGDLRISDTFGFLSFCHGVHTSSAVSCDENTVLYCISRDFVDQLADSSHAILSVMFYRYLASQLARLLKN